MDANRFDAISRLFAERRLSRRAAMINASSALAATGLPAAGLHAAAQHEATPTAADGGGAWAGEKIGFLFVQSFQSGSVTPKEGADGTYTLKLEQGLGQTIYFSDRPERIVGATPTDQFLQGLGFVVDNPPNAALVVAGADGTTDVAVLELFNPVFDPASPGVTYDVQVLAEWRKELEVDFHEEPGDLASLPATFGPVSLFIDDCPDSDISCFYDFLDNYVGTVASGAGMCWNYGLCQPCEPYGHTFPYYCAAVDYWRDKCKATFPDPCREFPYCDVNWGWLMPPFCS